MPPFIQRYGPLILFALCLMLAAAAAFVWLQRPSEIPVLVPKEREVTLPKRAFRQTQEVYDHIGPPILTLDYAPPRLELPDLRQILLYHGKNGRPDAETANPALYFSLQQGGGSSTSSLASVKPGQKLYLAIQRDLGPAKFTFSPRNEETPLWITITPRNEGKTSEVEVTLHMIDEKQEPVTTPSSHRFFTLNEREFPKTPQSPWEIGKWKVDATLLSRQRARWVGKDRFLERHGGEDYKDIEGKERIDFGEGDEAYSLFVAPKEIYIYKDDKWQSVAPGKESLNQAILIVKKVDDRLMTLELWDVQGKNKVTLNLLKASENFLGPSLKQSFKFIGARTRTQFVFEIDNEKMIIKPSDWLLLDDTGWHKLTTAKEIDDYVERRKIGTLFTFDKIIRKDDKQIMIGTLFSPNRTEAEEIELSMQPGTLPQTREPESHDTKDEEPPPILPKREVPHP